jgi:hypothetical protein
MCRAGFVQLFIANVLDRTPVCKVRAMVFPSKPREKFAAQDLCIPSSQIVQIVYGMQSESYGSFTPKLRENLARRICTSLQRKRFFWMTRVQPPIGNLVRFASIILGILPFVKLERLTFVDLVTLPFVNIVTLSFVKICS